MNDESNSSRGCTYFERCIIECSRILLSSDSTSNTAIRETISQLLVIPNVNCVYVYKKCEEEPERDKCLKLVESVYIKEIKDDFKFASKIFYKDDEKGITKILKKGEVYSSKIENIPSEFRDLVCPQVKSYLVAPINVKGEWWGFVGFNNCTNNDKWNNDEIRILKTVSEMIGVFIERQEADINRVISTELRFKASMTDRLVRVVSGFYHEMAPWLGSTITWTKKLIEAVENMEECKDETVKEYLNKILYGIVNANDLMTTLSRNTTLLQTYDVHDIDIMEFLVAWKNIILHNQDVKSVLEPHQIKISGGEARVRISNVILNQVLYNLLKNTIQHSDREEEDIVIEIFVKKDENNNRVILSFKDNGIRFPVDFHKKAFEFGQTTKDYGDNQGIGLWYCKEYLEKMNGDITLSPDFNKGALFIITLPLS